MELLIIVVLILAVLIIALVMSEDVEIGFMVMFFMVSIILITALVGYGYGQKAVKKSLLKDNKIEWKVSKDGQPYLILKDSTLSETWKYLK